MITLTRLRARAALLLVPLALTTAACGGSEPAAETGAGTSSGESAAADAGFPRDISHHKGTTTIESKPERIVALDNSLVEAVALLDRPLAGGISSYRNLKDFPPYLGDAVADTTEVGPMETPNLEKVAALKPDLIVSATVRHDELYDELSKIAPTVFVETTGPIWKDNVTLLGKALGEEERAEAALTEYEERARTVGDAINAKHDNPTISLVRFVDGPTRLYRNDSFSGIVLKDAGLSRPPSQDKPGFDKEISEEQIALADGDHIFVSAFEGGEGYQRRFQANPLWKRLDAVREGRVHDVKDELWYTSVSVQGAHFILDNLAEVFGVGPARS